jgi:tetratricopeptide (TPR) repeat protein
MDASNLIIIDGMYNIGLIYKDKMDEFLLSVEAFEDLESRFPENEHLLECYYQIYLMALRMKDVALAERYKAKMIAAFPDDDYTIAISDPDYEYNIRSMDSVQTAVYEATYQSYLVEDTAEVRRNYAEISTKYPLATLLPKFMFLHALTFVQAGDAEGFKEALKALVDKYPKADVSELAGEMLKGVLRGREMVQGSVKGMIWNLRFGLGADGTLSADDSARVFTGEKNMPCRIIMMYSDGRIDKNQLLFVVAAYNFANFIVKEFDLAFAAAGPVQMLTINGFINFDEALQYYKMIYGKDGYAPGLSKEIAIIPISDANYETLMRGKTIDEYIDFLEESYGDETAVLTARLKARMDAALMEEEPDAEPDEEPAGKPVEQTPPTPVGTLKEEPVPAGLLPADTVADTVVRRDTLTVITPVETLPADTLPVIDTTTPVVEQPPVKEVEKEKTPAQIRKEKEEAYKKRQQLRAKELKEKERAYKQKLKDKEKARREAQKAKKKR